MMILYKDENQNQNQNQDEAKTCHYCGKLFLPKTYNNLYCSALCRERYNEKKRIRERVSKTCDFCGQVYQITKNSDRSNRNHKRKGGHNLCECCRRNLIKHLNTANSNSHQTQIEPPVSDPKDIKWKDIPLPKDAKDFPGLVFPAQF